MRRPWWCGSRRTPRPHTQQRAAPRHLQIFSDKCKYFLQHTVCLHHTDTLTASRTYFGVVGNIDLLQLLFTLHSLDSLLLDVAVRGLPHVIILHEVLDRLPGEEVCPYFIETLTKLVLYDLLRKHNSYCSYLAVFLHGLLEQPRFGSSPVLHLVAGQLRRPILH